MRVLIMLVTLLLASPVWAKPAKTECVADDGSSFYMVAADGDVRVRWGDDGDWNKAFAKVEKVMILVTQLAPNGVIIIAWNTDTNAAYVVMKNDRTGKKTEFHARCWFK